MSIGSIIGGVVGGVIGFVVSCGNPMGAAIGAGIGFGLGMVIDPITPDVTNSAGIPNPEKTVMQSTTGSPIPDLAGAAKITGHLLCFGKEKNVAQYSDPPGGGKGGGSDPEPQLTGYKYYMSWALGICMGPVDVLCAIFKNDEIVWEGALSCPASGGEETIAIPGVGACVFYFGTNDHSQNSKVGEIIGDSTLNAPLRNMCWCFMDDCYIGEYNRTPTFSFVVKKQPENAFSSRCEIQQYDCNPAHVLWYILHNLIGLPEEWLHADDFSALAGALADEGRGISVLFDRQQSALTYMQMIFSHIDGIIRYGSDGKFHPKLIRGDYNVDDLPLLDETAMLDDPTFTRKSWIDTINEMKVQYTEIVGVSRASLWGAGYNNHGELCLGHTDQKIVFTQGQSVGEYVSCGFSATLLIDNFGTLWVVGSNTYGQLGLGDTSSRHVLTKVNTDTWKRAKMGFEVSLAVRADSSLWGAGRNHYGELGLGDKSQRNSLTFIGGGWQDVHCGSMHSAAIRRDGTLKVVGANSWGQLGLGDTQERLTFASVGPDFIDVACGYTHTVAIQLGGNILSTGTNNWGQLGLGDTDSRNSFTLMGQDWQSVSCGNSHTMAIQSDGTLWGTGYNAEGQLGLGDDNPRNVLTQVNQEIWTYVECGNNYTMAIKKDGTLWATGYNSFGQLGLGDTDTRYVFTQVGEDTWKSISCGNRNSVGFKD
ncbi:MAG: hypothetical protein JRC60_00245 [Deltaproteobacteria bacterium]|nr:hypothetical protein [Deltaproteobacteria bacterium]